MSRPTGRDLLRSLLRSLASVGGGSGPGRTADAALILDRLPRDVIGELRTMLSDRDSAAWDGPGLQSELQSIPDDCWGLILSRMHRMEDMGSLTTALERNDLWGCCTTNGRVWLVQAAALLGTWEPSTRTLVVDDDLVSAVQRLHGDHPVLARLRQDRTVRVDAGLLEAALMNTAEYGTVRTSGPGGVSAPPWASPERCMPRGSATSSSNGCGAPCGQVTNSSGRCSPAARPRGRWTP